MTRDCEKALRRPLSPPPLLSGHLKRDASLHREYVRTTDCSNALQALEMMLHIPKALLLMTALTWVCIVAVMVYVPETLDLQRKCRQSLRDFGNSLFQSGFTYTSGERTHYSSWVPASLAKSAPVKTCSIPDVSIAYLWGRLPSQGVPSLKLAMKNASYRERRARIVEWLSLLEQLAETKEIPSQYLFTFIDNAVALSLDQRRLSEIEYSETSSILTVSEEADAGAPGASDESAGFEDEHGDVINSRFDKAMHLGGRRGRTTISVENIPFAVTKDKLMKLLDGMELPIPQTLDYHFDDGVFRGKAFASFTSHWQANAVIATLDRLNLRDRKLRVKLLEFSPSQDPKPHVHRLIHPDAENTYSLSHLQASRGKKPSDTHQSSRQTDRAPDSPDCDRELGQACSISQSDIAQDQQAVEEEGHVTPMHESEATSADNTTQIPMERPLRFAGNPPSTMEATREAMMKNERHKVSLEKEIRHERVVNDLHDDAEGSNRRWTQRVLRSLRSRLVGDRRPGSPKVPNRWVRTPTSDSVWFSSTGLTPSTPPTSPPQNIPQNIPQNFLRRQKEEDWLDPANATAQEKESSIGADRGETRTKESSGKDRTTCTGARGATPKFLTPEA